MLRMTHVRWKPAFAGMTMLSVSAALAQTANPNAEMMQQLQKMMAGKKSQEALGQAVVIGTMLNCTQKTAGKEATQAFYAEIKTIGKTVEGYCKNGHATEARALLLATVEQNASHPVTTAALGCYDQQLPNIAALGGARMATDAARYARWVRDPEAAKTQMQETDVCVNQPPATAKR
jgi:hypothetical protein